MKLLYNIKLLLFISLYSTIFCSAQSVNFYRQYSSTRELILNSIDTTSDGGYISAGFVKNSIGSDYYVVKTDSLGIEQWRRENTLYNSLDSSNKMYAIKQLPDSSYIMCGEIDDFQVGLGSRLLGYLVKLDSNGGMIWEKMIGDTIDRIFIDIQIFSDNSFLILGEKHDSTRILTLEKYDSAGNSIWYQEYNFYPDLIYSNNTIVKCLNSDFLLLAHLNFGQNIGIIRVDSTGNLIIKNAISGVSNEKGIAVKEIGNYSYELITRQELSPYNSRIFQLDSLLTISSVSTFSQLWSAAIVDSMIFYGAFLEMYVYKGNSFGDSIWYQYINEPTGIPNKTIVNRKGCPVTCGNIDDGSATISVGFLLEVCDSTSTTNINLLKDDVKLEIYPNPSNQNLNIMISEEFFLNADTIELFLYDQGGELQRNFILTAPRLVIENDNLPPGVYIICLYSHSQSIISKKIIIK